MHDGEKTYSDSNFKEILMDPLAMDTSLAMNAPFGTATVRTERSLSK